VTDACRNIPLEQRISSIPEGDVTHFGAPVCSRRLTVQPRKKTDVHYHWQEGSATGVDPDVPKIWAPVYSQINPDIVTRLRELAGDWDYIGLMPKDDLREAAAEIERLRAQLEQSRQDHLATFLELMDERCG